MTRAATGLRICFSDVDLHRSQFAYLWTNLVHHQGIPALHSIPAGEKALLIAPIRSLEREAS